MDKILSDEVNKRIDAFMDATDGVDELLAADERLYDRVVTGYDPSAKPVQMACPDDQQAGDE